MSVIIRLQNLSWSAASIDIRQFFYGLSIPEGGVHIVGGPMGDAFIVFTSDEDARQAMARNGEILKDSPVKLLLSSRMEMQNVIEMARNPIKQPVEQAIVPAIVPPEIIYMGGTKSQNTMNTHTREQERINSRDYDRRRGKSKSRSRSSSRSRSNRDRYDTDGRSSDYSRKDSVRRNRSPSDVSRSRSRNRDSYDDKHNDRKRRFDDRDDRKYKFDQNDKKSVNLRSSSEKIPVGIKQSKYDDICYVKVRGLPLSANHIDIKDFFKNVNIPGKGVKLVTENMKGRTTGTAYIRLDSKKDQKEALRRHNRYFGPNSIQVTSSNEAEYVKYAGKGNDEQPTKSNKIESTVIMLKGLPINCQYGDIGDCFQGLNIVNLLILYGPNGKVLGDGFVEFETLADAKLALFNGQKKIRNCIIEMKPTNKDVMIKAMPKEPEMKIVEEKFPILMQGLPFNASDKDINEFFADNGASPQSIFLLLTGNGMSTGEAFAVFNCQPEAELALRKNGQYMGLRQIALKPVPNSELQTVLSSTRHIVSAMEFLKVNKSTKVGNQTPVGHVHNVSNMQAENIALNKSQSLEINTKYENIGDKTFANSHNVVNERSPAGGAVNFPNSNYSSPSKLTSVSPMSSIHSNTPKGTNQLDHMNINTSINDPLAYNSLTNAIIMDLQKKAKDSSSYNSFQSGYTNPIPGIQAFNAQTNYNAPMNTINMNLPPPFQNIHDKPKDPTQSSNFNNGHNYFNPLNTANSFKDGIIPEYNPVDPNNVLNRLRNVNVAPNFDNRTPPNIPGQPLLNTIPMDPNKVHSYANLDPQRYGMPNQSTFGNGERYGELNNAHHANLHNAGSKDHMSDGPRCNVNSESIDIVNSNSIFGRPVQNEGPGRAMYGESGNRPMSGNNIQNINMDFHNRSDHQNAPNRFSSAFGLQSQTQAANITSNQDYLGRRPEHQERTSIGNVSGKRFNANDLEVDVRESNKRPATHINERNSGGINAGINVREDYRRSLDSDGQGIHFNKDSLGRYIRGNDARPVGVDVSRINFGSNNLTSMRNDPIQPFNRGGSEKNSDGIYNRNTEEENKRSLNIDTTGRQPLINDGRREMQEPYGRPSEGGSSQGRGKYENHGHYDSETGRNFGGNEGRRVMGRGRRPLISDAGSRSFNENNQGKEHRGGYGRSDGRPNQSRDTRDNSYPSRNDSRESGLSTRNDERESNKRPIRSDSGRSTRYDCRDSSGWDSRNDGSRKTDGYIQRKEMSERNDRRSGVDRNFSSGSNQERESREGNVRPVSGSSNRKLGGITSGREGREENGRHKGGETLGKPVDKNVNKSDGSKSGNPGSTNANNTDGNNPMKPTENNRTKPTENNPVKPVGRTPAKPSVNNPAKSIEHNAAKPKVNNPVKPIESNSVKPTVNGPVKPTVNNPVKPADNNSVKAVVSNKDIKSQERNVQQASGDVYAGNKRENQATSSGRNIGGNNQNLETNDNRGNNRRMQTTDMTRRNFNLVGTGMPFGRDGHGRQMHGGPGMSFDRDGPGSLTHDDLRMSNGRDGPGPQMRDVPGPQMRDGPRMAFGGDGPRMPRGMGSVRPLMFGSRPNANFQGPPNSSGQGVDSFGQPGCVIAATNIPFQAGVNEILEFFSEFGIRKENIIRRFNENGMATGDARVAFNCNSDALRSVHQLHKQPLRGRPVSLFLL